MKSKKSDLFILSIVILAMTALALIQSIVNVAVNGIAVEPKVAEGITLPAGADVAVGVATFIFGIILLLPQVFVGYRGLLNAKGPMQKQGHITWAKVLFVLAIVSAVFSIISIFGTKDLLNSIFNIAEHVINVGLYYLYIKYAKSINKVA